MKLFELHYFLVSPLEMGSFFAKPVAPAPLPLVRTNKYTTNASGAPMPYIRIPPSSGGSRKKARKSLKKQTRKQRR